MIMHTQIIAKKNYCFVFFFHQLMITKYTQKKHSECKLWGMIMHTQITAKNYCFVFFFHQLMITKYTQKKKHSECKLWGRKANILHAQSSSDESAVEQLYITNLPSLLANASCVRDPRLRIRFLMALKGMCIAYTRTHSIHSRVGRAPLNVHIQGAVKNILAHKTRALNKRQKASAHTCHPHSCTCNY